MYASQTSVICFVARGNMINVNFAVFTFVQKWIVTLRNKRGLLENNLRITSQRHMKTKSEFSLNDKFDERNKFAESVR